MFFDIHNITKKFRILIKNKFDLSDKFSKKLENNMNLNNLFRIMNKL